MKSTGIVRGIDDLGRIVLPKELRTSLNITPESKLEISVDGETILLKKHLPAGACALCGKQDPDAKELHGKTICSSCCDALRAL